MPSFKVNVKWGSESYKGVEVDTDQEPLVFKAQLFALTGVNTDRQKVVVKGKIVPQHGWDNIKLKNGQTILMMGSVEENNVDIAPQDRVKFIEDMSEQDLVAVLDLPSGLTNLGNTCYMNATVQCLKTVPELTTALKAYSDSGMGSLSSSSPAESIISALKQLYSAMKQDSTVPPVILLQVLHDVFPRFAEKGEGGRFIQQDANECWTELVRMLQQKLYPAGNGDVEQDRKSVIDTYFGGMWDVEMKCDESETEAVTKSTESFTELNCHINTDIKYLDSGLRAAMKGSIEKRSPTLDRDALYTKTSMISRLPAYLRVQFIRFYYKEKENVNAKILKEVKFTMILDLYELCTPELQKKLMPMRDKFKEQEDKKVHQATEIAMKGTKKKEKKTNKLPYAFEDDVGSNNSGYYELQAVLTHQGRTSSSGHYIGWVRRNNTEWVKCDDDDISLIHQEDILKLAGGGDWHCAYVLLYGPRVLEVEEEEEEMEQSGVTVEQTMDTQ